MAQITGAILFTFAAALLQSADAGQLIRPGYVF